MARLPVVPPPEIRAKLRGIIQITTDRGTIVAKRWPRRRPGPASPAEMEQREIFKQWVQDLKQIAPIEIDAAKGLAKYSGYTYRDILSRASLGRMIIWDWLEGDPTMDFNVQTLLDQLGTDNGLIIVRAGGVWLGVLPGDPGDILTIDGDGELPIWSPPAPGGITELTGDGTAGPGSGSQELTLADTGVSPSTYSYATITVDSKGRISEAEGHTPEEIVGAGAGTQVLDAQASAATLPNTTVETTLYSYTLPADTLDTIGRGIRITCWGTCATNSNVKNMRLYFGATSLLWSWNFSNRNEWYGQITVLRTGPTTQIMWLDSWSAQDGTLPAYIVKRATPAETLSGTILTKLTAQTPTGASNQIIADNYLVERV